MIVQLSIEIKGLRGYEQGADFAQSLADHITETFNDDDSISPLMQFRLFRNDGVTEIARPGGSKTPTRKAYNSLICAECGNFVLPLQESESTYCGSMHTGCRDRHNQHCSVCEEDAS